MMGKKIEKEISQAMSSSCLAVIECPHKRHLYASRLLQGGLFSQIQTASEVAESLHLLTEDAFDCILTDLPLERGLPLLCRRAGAHHIPVVCVVPEQERGLPYLEAGATDCFSEEIHLHEMGLRLSRHMEVKRRMAHLQRVCEEFSRQALTDNLTGLGNRRYFQQRLQAEIARSHRSGTPFSLVMIDIDHFKRLNDTRGHLAGDRALQIVSRTLRENIRCSDLACRLGGEEFVLLLPDTDLSQAEVLAKKLREAVAGATRSEGVPLTVSMGVTASTRVPRRAPEKMLEEADRALYAAKKGGRNRTEVYRPHTAPRTVPLEAMA